MKRYKIVPLEERIVLDAALVASIVTTATTDHSVDAHHDQSAAATESSDSSQTANSDQPFTTDTSSTQESSPSANPDTSVRVLILSNKVTNAETLAASAGSNVLVVSYDPGTSTVDSLLQLIHSKADGKVIDSIALALPGQGDLVKLADNLWITPDSVNDGSMTHFFTELGSMVKEGGYVDFLTCNLTQFGTDMVSDIDNLLDLSGHDINVAASNDFTSNHFNWNLEYGNRDAGSLYFDSAKLSQWEGHLATFTVTSLSDATAIAGALTLRQAINNANFAPGIDTIDFSVAGTINLTSLLPVITEGVIIDATTAPGYSAATRTPVVSINDGASFGWGLRLSDTVTDVTIRGLAINGFDTGIGLGTTSAASPDNITIQYSWFGNTSALNNGISALGGATDVVLDSNLFKNITNFSINTFSTTSQNLRWDVTNNVFGMSWDQTTAAGSSVGSYLVMRGATNSDIDINHNTFGVAQNASGLEFNQLDTSIFDSNAVGTNTAHTLDLSSLSSVDSFLFNVSSGNANNGFDTTISNNYFYNVGTYSKVLNLFRVQNYSVLNNVFANTPHIGIHLSSATNSIVQGNTLLGGLSATEGAIDLHNADNTLVKSNTILGSAGPGITLTTGIDANPNSTGNQITQNSIYNNGGLGIDIGPTGVNANDLGDTDAGNNNLQNYPVFTVLNNGSLSTITGTLNSLANHTYRIEFFWNTAADSSGFGEGQSYLNSINVNTDASGNASFSTSFVTAILPVGYYVTATATDILSSDWVPADFSTSEFSQAVQVVANAVVPSISIDDASASEGNTMTFTVSLSSAPTQQVTVQYQTADDTATIGDNDYNAIAPTTLTWNVGDPLTKTFTVQTNGDNYAEANETFFITLLGATNATIADNQGVGTITNDDIAGIIVTPVSGLVTTEAGGTAQFSVVLTSAPRTPVTINLASSDASEGVVSGSLTFNDTNWNVAQVVTVTGQDDAIVDGNIAYNVITGVAPGSDSAYVALNPADVALTNTDNDVATLSINDVSLVEGDSGTVDFTFTVTLSNPSDSVVTVNYQIADGTATIANNDYIAQALNTLTFNPGDPLTQTITVKVQGDLVSEAYETFFVNLSSPTNATIADGIGQGTIQNNEANLTLSSVASITEVDTGSVTFTYSLALDNQVAFNFTTGITYSGTATAADYTASTAVFTFNSGTTSLTRVVTVLGDYIKESNETINLNLGSPSNLKIHVVNPSVTTTITNNDFLVVTAGGDSATSVDASDVSIRKAMLVANATPGADTISFALPNVTTVTLTSSPLPSIFEAVTIDGTTMPGYAGAPRFYITRAPQFSFGGFFIVANVDNITIRGLGLYGFSNLSTSAIEARGVPPNPGSIDNITIEDNYFGLAADGTPSSNATNIFIGPANNWTIDNNVFAGSGTGIGIFFLNEVSINNINITNNTFGFNASQTVGAGISSGINSGTSTAFLNNVNVTGNTFGIVNGISVFLRQALNSTVSNNIFGTDAATKTFVGSQNGSISMTGSFSGSNNVISDNYITNQSATSNTTAPVISLVNASDTQIIRNTIENYGVNLSSNRPTAVLQINQGNNIIISENIIQNNKLFDNANTTYFDGNAIIVFGRSFASASGTISKNIIRNNIGGGIAITGDSTIFNITQNSIYNNIIPAGFTGGLGIDLSITNFTPNGVTPNDPLDADIFQNYPVIAYAVESSGQTYINGTLQSAPNSSFRIEFFANAAADATGYGEGQTYLDSIIVNTDAAGNASFSKIFSPSLLPLGAYLTTTATDLSNNTTSEFSQAVQVIAPPSISIDDFSASEGNTLTFTISLSSTPFLPLTVQYQSDDDTATIGDNDYIGIAPATLSWNPGDPLTKTITVQTNGDNYAEANETLFINLVNPTNGSIADSQGVGTITNDDTAGIIVTPVSGLVTTEAGGTAQFSVVLTSAPRSDVTINLASSDASEGIASGSLTFNSTNWNVAQVVTVNGQDDNTVDGDIAYNVITSVASGSDSAYVGLNPDDVALTNTDNDVAYLSINDVTVSEGNNGTVNATFTVTLSNPSDSIVTVNYLIEDGSATLADSDYNAQALTLTFNPGESLTQTITIQINGDNYVEGNETFLVKLLDATNATISDDQGVGTINNDDTAGIIVTPVSGLVTTEAGGTAQFSVVLTSAPRTPVTISFGSSDASEGVASGSLTFDSNNWNVAQVVTVTGQDDAIVDGSIAYSVITSVDSGSDSDYVGINPADVSLVNLDNDVATGTAKLWGIDQTDGQLFSIGDPLNPLGTFTDYGQLQYYDPVSQSNQIIGNLIQSLAIDGNNIGYFVVNDNLSGYGYHALLKIDLNTVIAGSNNVATVVDIIGDGSGGHWNGYNPSNDITGLAIDPTTGLLYGIVKTPVADSLAIIDPTNGSATIIGKMIGENQKIVLGEDLKFDDSGNLYVTDNVKDKLYKVNTADGRILSIADNNEKGGLGVDNLQLKALAWYSAGNTFIGTDDSYDSYGFYDLANGNNINHATLTSLGLTDVQGLDFTNKAITSNQALILDKHAQLYAENMSEIFVVESANILLNGNNLANGHIIFSFENGSGAYSDVLSISNKDGITVIGDDIYYNAVLIGTKSGGIGGVPLTINFNSSITEAGAEHLVQALTFKNTSENPGTNARTVGILVQNSTGGFSNNALKAIDVQAINDAPSIADINDISNITKNTMTWVKDSSNNTLSVSDVDAGNDIMSLELNVKHGALTIDLAALGLTSYAQLESVFGIDFYRGDGNADKSIAFYGTITQINQVLGALKYLNTTNNNDLLTVTVNDSANGGSLSDTETVRLYMN